MFRTWLHILIPLAYVFMGLVAAGVYKGLFFKARHEANLRYSNYAECMQFEFYLPMTLTALFWPFVVPAFLILVLVKFLFRRVFKSVIDRVARLTEKLRE